MLDLVAPISTAGHRDRDAAATLNLFNLTTALTDQTKVRPRDVYRKLKVTFYATRVRFSLSLSLPTLSLSLFLNVLHQICSHGNPVIQTSH